jgi:potassium/sodium efflux P-type ATPase
MLTGDHPKTAAVIAREIGILPPNYRQGIDAVSAVDFDKISDEKLLTMRLPRVIARCSPTTKVKMVNALQARKQIVVMTGDGTNDAPSLKIANIGVAMGMAGSDVAKQASDIILTDDNFATIVKAVAEGRRIFSNVQKFVSHLMTTNVSEIIALVIGLAFTDQKGESVFPMSAIEILVLNMLTSSPPAIGLGMEPASPEQMKTPPRDSSKRGSGVFSLELITDIFYYGTVMGVLTLAVWSVALYANFRPNLAIGLTSPLGFECNDASNLDVCSYVFRARAASYATLSFMFMIHSYNLRSLKYSIIRSQKYGPGTFGKNKVLVWSNVFGFFIVITTLYIPGLNVYAFLHQGISWEWLPVIVSQVLFLGFAEGYKYCKRHYFPKSFFAAEYNPHAEYEMELQEILSTK